MFDSKEIKIPIIYSDSYYVEIGEHVFPTSKYMLIKEKIEKTEHVKQRIEMMEPKRATDEEVLRVHTREYIDKLKNCSLDADEIFTLELPVSKEIVEAAFITCGGTITAAKVSLKRKAAIHLGGGFHHAFSDHGEGFCILNDIAVSIKALQNEKLIKKAMVIDCDLHQGNGTADIFKNDASVFTFSIHQENNYPFYKPKSTVDIGLADYANDKTYLDYLYENIPKIVGSFSPDIIFYLAGADPFREDQLGSLALTKEGLRERDKFICTQALNFGVPLVITLAGGYAKNREDTVDIHFGTIEECVMVFTVINK